MCFFKLLICFVDFRVPYQSNLILSEWTRGCSPAAHLGESIGIWCVMSKVRCGLWGCHHFSSGIKSAVIASKHLRTLVALPPQCHAASRACVTQELTHSKNWSETRILAKSMGCETSAFNKLGFGVNMIGAHLAPWTYTLVQSYLQKPSLVLRIPQHTYTAWRTQCPK